MSLLARREDILLVTATVIAISAEKNGIDSVIAVSGFISKIEAPIIPTRT